ncbi:MAG: glycosyltransferase family 39 protein [Candidatus Margulisiibacteriota bacterium]|jgi:4-amino-4-deoxy-L-arabinose transferase-like glycosyltransferase
MKIKLVNIIKHPLFLILLLSFFVFSWPFFHFPLTDGDISNWAKLAKEVSCEHNFLTAKSDQSHGPLLVWGSSVFLLINHNSFYFYNLFNLVCGLLGLIFIYFFSQKLWQNKSLSILNTVIAATSLVYIYFSRTPMHDWPCAIFYFGFVGFYLTYLQEKKISNLVLALFFISLSSMGRFSISLGLAFIFVFLANLILKRNFGKALLDLFLVILIPILANLPWIIIQTLHYKQSFLMAFLYDNVGRFFIDLPADKKVQFDFYSFPLYIIGGIWPYTFLFFLCIFRKGIIKDILSNKKSLLLISGFLPGLLIFSLSGHTKLLRYIAFVYPTFIMFFGYYLTKLKMNYKTVKLANIFSIFTFLLLIITTIVLFLQFSKETKESLLFTLSFISILFYSQFILMIIINLKFESFLKNAHKFMWLFTLGYLIFVSILSYCAIHLSFLTSVHNMIVNSLH